MRIQPQQLQLPVLNARSAFGPAVGAVKPFGKGKTLRDSIFWDMERDGITQSTIQTFVDCPMKAYRKMFEGLKAGDFDRRLQFGTYFHDVLDSVYTQRKRKPDFPWLKIGRATLDAIYEETVESLDDPRDVETFDQVHGLCEVVLTEYFNWYKKEDTKLKILAVEKQFAFPYTLRNGRVIMVRGKIDLIEEKNGKEIWIWDHKTKSAIEINDRSRITVGAIAEKMDWELQIMVYCLAVYHLYGKYPTGVVYNLVKTPGQEFKGSYNKKPETLQEFYQRVLSDMDAKSDPRTRNSEYFLRLDISVTQKEIEYWRDTDFDYIIERIYEWSQGGIASYRNSKNCAAFRKPCEFLRICSSNDRSGYKKRESVFPELEEGED